jgi:hypothetical protein
MHLWRTLSSSLASGGKTSENFLYGAVILVY